MLHVPVPPIRKADFWWSLVLIAAAAAMLAQSLTFPLRGTYAGVRNAWYVSPALFPLIISTTLIILGALLLLRAVRAGGAAAALADVRVSTIAGFVRASATFWIIAGAMVAYVYGFIPYIDFIAATALFLLCLSAGFHLAGARTGAVLLMVLVALGLVLFAASLAGPMPGPRTTAAFVLDGAVWAVFAAAAGTGFLATAGEQALRRRFWHCLGTSLITAFVLGIVFKYGLLVPLPREGVTVALLDPVFYTLRAAL